MKELEYRKHILEKAKQVRTKEQLDELLEEWFSKKRFYGKAKNEPNKILELKFNRLDFRPEENLLFIHFKVLNSWATDIFYRISDYGKTWALTEGELKL